MDWLDVFENKRKNKAVEIVEQIERVGCFGFTVVHIPGTWFRWCVLEKQCFGAPDFL